VLSSKVLSSKAHMSKAILPKALSSKAHSFKGLSLFLDSSHTLCHLPHWSGLRFSISLRFTPQRMNLNVPRRTVDELMEAVAPSQFLAQQVLLVSSLKSLKKAKLP
jgi:hypothetical protein